MSRATREQRRASRARILLALREQALNANELAKRLTLDYSTVRRHLDLLVDQHVVTQRNAGYGAQYAPADEVEAHWETVDRILEVER